jgi:hypothetical protein
MAIALRIAQIVSLGVFIYGALLTFKQTNNIWGGESCCTGAYFMFAATTAYLLASLFASIQNRAVDKATAEAAASAAVANSNKQ